MSTELKRLVEKYAKLSCLRLCNGPEFGALPLELREEIYKNFPSNRALPNPFQMMQICLLKDLEILRCIYHCRDVIGRRDSIIHQKLF